MCVYVIVSQSLGMLLMSGVPVVLVTVAEGSERSPLRSYLNRRG